MGRTPPRDHLAQLRRMRDMKATRLANYQGRDSSWLKADIGALNYAIRIVEAALASDVASELYERDLLA